MPAVMTQIEDVTLPYCTVLSRPVPYRYRIVPYSTATRTPLSSLLLPLRPFLLSIRLLPRPFSHFSWFTTFLSIASHSLTRVHRLRINLFLLFFSFCLFRPENRPSSCSISHFPPVFTVAFRDSILSTFNGKITSLTKKKHF